MPALEHVKIEVFLLRERLEFAVSLRASGPSRFQVASQFLRLAEFPHVVLQPFLAIGVKPLTALGKFLPEELSPFI